MAELDAPMTEANQVNGAIRENLGPYGRFQRVEHAHEVGWPDWRFIVHGVAGWIEAKLIAKHGRPPPHLTVDQIVWGEEETRHGGSWYLLGLRLPRTWVVYDAPRTREWFDGRSNAPLIQRVGAFPTREIMLLLLGRNAGADNP